MPALSELRDSPAATAAVEAWRWWTGELAAMMPDRFRPATAKAARADIRPGRDSVEVELIREGIGQRYADQKKLEDLDAEGWAELAALVEGSRTRILLQSPDAFVSEIHLPKAARRRLRSAVALQLSQIAPVDPSLLRWATAVEEAGPDRIAVRVAMARPERIEHFQALFEANGIDPPPVCVETQGGIVELARGSRIAGTRGDRAGRKEWAIAALLVASIPFTTALGATMLKSSVETRIQVLGRTAMPRLKDEAQARRSERLRQDLRPLFTRPSVSATLEELAARLPLTDHVKSVQQGEDRTLQFVVETPDAEAAEAALKGSRILPRATVADIAPASAGRLSVTFRTAPR